MDCTHHVRVPTLEATHCQWPQGAKIETRKGIALRCKDVAIGYPGGRQIATAAADNEISKTESKTIRARWEELKSVTEGFVHCCEHGNFGALKAKKHAHDE